MYIGIADQESGNHPFRPVAVRESRGQDDERDEQRHGPELSHETDKHSLIDLFRDPRPKQQMHNEDRVGRYCEKIRLERAEAQSLAGKRDVRQRRRGRDRPAEPDEIKGPQVVVSESFPDQGPAQPLAVVHCGLAGIVAQDARHHDDFLLVCEPPFLGSEEALEPVPRRLRWRGRQIEPREDSDQESETAFNEEQVPPPGVQASADVQDPFS